MVREAGLPEGRPRPTGTPLPPAGSCTGLADGPVPQVGDPPAMALLGPGGGEKSPEEPASPQGASPPGHRDRESSPQGSAPPPGREGSQMGRTQMECPGHCGFPAVTPGGRPVTRGSSDHAACCPLQRPQLAPRPHLAAPHGQKQRGGWGRGRPGLGGGPSRRPGSAGAASSGTSCPRVSGSCLSP